MGRRSKTEELTIDRLRRMPGCQGFVRAAGSFGPADFVAFFHRLTWLIQVVGPSDRPTLEEAHALIALQSEAARRVSHIWRWKWQAGHGRTVPRNQRRYELEVIDLCGVSEHDAEVKLELRPATPTERRRKQRRGPRSKPAL